LVQDVFTPEECLQIVQAAEAIGFEKDEAAGGSATQKASVSFVFRLAVIVSLVAGSSKGLYANGRSWRATLSGSLIKASLTIFTLRSSLLSLKRRQSPQTAMAEAVFEASTPDLGCTNTNRTRFTV
jgi:hypothetical protein